MRYTDVTDTYTEAALRDLARWVYNETAPLVATGTGRIAEEAQAAIAADSSLRPPYLADLYGRLEAQQPGITTGTSHSSDPVVNGALFVLAGDIARPIAVGVEALGRWLLDGVATVEVIDAVMWTELGHRAGVADTHLELWAALAGDWTGTPDELTDTVAPLVRP